MQKAFGICYAMESVSVHLVSIRWVLELIQSITAAFSEVPAARFNVDAFHHAATDRLNTLSTKGGHFLREDVSAFDASFFNMTTEEACATDPQQRILLEVAYEALENAGVSVKSVAGSETSCYVGCFTQDWREMIMQDTETSPKYSGTGAQNTMLSNRVSWFFDLRGPSMTIDTACSSSLVGLHLACQSLRFGESKMALVGGSNLMLSPDMSMWMSNLHFLSKDGLSKSFDASADGYGRGEGVAFVLLKPVSDAIRDGNVIRAVIRGTGINQDGKTPGITVPNSEAQAELIRSTYRAANLPLDQTGYFEAHVMLHPLLPVMIMTDSIGNWNTRWRPLGVEGNRGDACAPP
jgi:acyl transferase domain-containing protein